MTSLRILKKRDGSFEIQRKLECHHEYSEAWVHDETLPIVEEHEPEKGLEQTMYEAWIKACGSNNTWESETEKWKSYYRIEAQAAKAWFLAHGWKEPER